MQVTESTLRNEFFEHIFGEGEGYVCIATAPIHDPRKMFRQTFFSWPRQKTELFDFVEAAAPRKNVWYCPSLLSKAERLKEYCKAGDLLWADLDSCNPENVEPAPTLVTMTSNGRYQALWRVDQELNPDVIEDYNKRIAYKYIQDGADPSGWDLSQLLRVPFTFNFKYDLGNNGYPLVTITRANTNTVSLDELEKLDLAPASNAAEELLTTGMPDLADMPEPEAIIYKYHNSLKKSDFLQLYTEDPHDEADWSKLLWKLINLGFEAGMEQEEVFAVAHKARCNKYERDGRSAKYLWRDVIKAGTNQQRLTVLVGDFQELALPMLVNDDEVSALPKTFIDDYRAWGEIATDAIPAYHDLSAFMLLSAVLAGNVKLGTSYGTMQPNLWGLILGDSTLTRKTTAMKMAIEFIMELDSELVIATDGSAEGLLSGLSLRPEMTSVFYKDEVTGLFDSINRKDYLAGLPETLTQLYDVPPVYTRLLRKEKITITKPVFIFYGGGIREKVYSLLSEEYVLSGFLPRFLVVSGDTDMSRIRRTGPATATTSTQRTAIQTKLADLKEHFVQVSLMRIGGSAVEVSSSTDVTLTDEAWERYGAIEMAMAQRASESNIALLALPTFERLSRSLLKMAVLLAASDFRPVVELRDVIKAAWYIQDWGRYSIDLIQNCGKGATERALNRTLKYIAENPGVMRSQVMQRYHLTSRVMSEIQDTLEDRGQLRVVKKGRGVQLWVM